MTDSIDPLRCPICGTANECAVAQGRGTCWCFTQNIPDDVLEKIPLESRQRACVCKGCACGTRDPSSAFARMRQILRQRGG